MTEFLLVLCAILASLALGVLGAYGVCQALFHIFRTHAQSAAQMRVASRPLQPLQQ